MKKLHIKTGDTVVVLSGDDKNKSGEVVAVSPEEGKVIVKGVNMIHKHVKPRKQGEAGGIIDAESALYASKVALYCPKCKKGVRTKSQVVDGVKIRVCAKCGAGLIHREDDTESVVQSRLNVYTKQTAPLIEYYESKGILRDVDGGKSIDAVFEDIKKLLDAKKA